MSGPDHRPLDRPRLTSVLDGRFARRVTVVTAGAGFGKTTLLRQAVARNDVDPQGDDVWLSCRPSHARPGEFAAALGRAVGIDGRGADPVADVCDALWSRAPRDVALVIDDVHLVADGGPTDAFLQELLDALPANAHLVLAGRTAPPVRLARLSAAGEAVQLDERDLSFTGEEQTAFLAARAPERDAVDLGGWPALLELSVAAGAADVGDFLWEEVLHSLSPAHRRGLARLLSLDWVDAPRINAAVGPDTGLAEVIEELPLIHRDDLGRSHFHDLWARVLGDVDPEWDVNSLGSTVEMLMEGGWHTEALELTLAHGTVGDVDELVRRYAVEEVEHLPSSDVETLLSLLPTAARNSRYGRFLEGRLEIRRTPRSAKPKLEAARDGFRAHDEPALEVAVLGLLGQIAFSEWDADELAGIASAAEATELPAGRSLAAMTEATRLIVDGAPFADVRLALEAARSFGVSLGGADGVAAGVACRLRGVPEEGRPIIERALGETTRANAPLLLANDFDVKWLLGEVADADLSRLDAGPMAGLAEMSHQASNVSGLLAFNNVVDGRVRPARRHLEHAEAFTSQRVRGGLAMPSAARLALAISDGRDDVASIIAEEEIDASVLDDPGIRRAIPMATLVSGKVRAEFETVDLGPCYERGRAAVEALRSLREDGDAGPAAALDWQEPDRFTRCLVPPLVLELALAASENGDRSAEAIARRLAGGDRAALRRLADAGPPLVRGPADRLRKEVPARPDDRIEIRTLGAFELRRDGEPLDDAGLRRGKVRALLQYLVSRGSCRREELGVALWPDFDEEATANNLRVTLSHATKLLEPERAKGEPAYRLRADGDRVTLHFDDALAVDVDAFEELLDAAEAADRRGRPARTLTLLDHALARYGGDYLGDAAEPAWGEAERTRLRHRFVAAALRAGELRLGAGELDDALALATRARDADAYCEPAARLEALVYLRRDDRSAARAALDRLMAEFDDAGLEVEPETAALRRRAGAAAASSG